MKVQPTNPTPADRKPEASGEHTVNVQIIDLRKPGAFVPLLVNGGHDD